MEEITRRAYDAWGRNFARQRQAPWEELHELLAFTKKGDRVLDVGCGFGRLYQLLESVGVSYVGVDQSEEQLRIARELFPKGEFRKADMAALPFPDASFDVVYCIAALHHLPTAQRRAAAMKEMARVVKPASSADNQGGFVMFTNWNLSGAWAKKQMEKSGWKKIDESDYLVPLRDEKGQLLGERFYHGFTPEELEALLMGADLLLYDQYFFQKGRTDATQGRNLITIAKKKSPR